MRTKVHVVTRERFQAWLHSLAAASTAGGASEAAGAGTSGTATG
jgi:heme/copper-type cytochrome/quinol oxidase subunit 2